ncbi:MAG: GH32 C-terminal domain-containing protein [Lachnospiraceae bacterium]|nr:GH32 C-terminal domain-containing protein [Lachnospiraceae bacterium]
MRSEKLQQAREYEQAELATIEESTRPVFHVTGAVGWINDPNGFSVYQGEYHLFFQYHPYSTFWGPMHWGHVKTRDFVTWERLPIAMAPDEAYDNKGCFSGSAMELPNGKQLLVYTGVSECTEADGTKADYQQQCIAIGDGVDYEKYVANPVITTSAIPSGNHRMDFRDPKVFSKDGKYYLVVGNRTADTSGAILLYCSMDAKSWEYVGVIDRSNDEYGKMWECPDYFALDDYQVMLTSPQDMLPKEGCLRAGNKTIALLGHGDGLLEFQRESVQPIDQGIDFYAPQTLETTDGRRVMIAWMQSWDTCNVGHDDKRFFGQMTFPRELRIVDGTLRQTPVRELASYYTDCVSHSNVAIQGDCVLEDVCGKVYDMTVTIRPNADMNWFKVNVGVQGDYKTVIKYDATEGMLYVDRSCNYNRRELPSVCAFHVTLDQQALKLRMLKDKNCLEVFVNDGRWCCSMMLSEGDDARGISFQSYGSAEFDVTKNGVERNGK